MAREIRPQDTTRASAYGLWKNAPNPMVTFFKTLDVTILMKISKMKQMKLNMLLDFCIGKAAVSIKEFYMLQIRNIMLQILNRQQSPGVVKYYHIYDKGGVI